MGLKLGHFGKENRNTRKVLKCEARVGWSRSVGPFVSEMKYYIESRKRGISYIEYIEGRLSGLVTSCEGTAF
jgi:hypothetical protein